MNRMALALVFAFGLPGCARPGIGAGQGGGAPAPVACPAVDSPARSHEDGELPDFHRYPVPDFFQGMPAAVNLASHPDAERFAEALVAGLDQGPNFAGHYRLVSWSCGTQCSASLIVDVSSGAVHDGVVAELDMLFRVDSALLIVNPHPEKYFEVGEMPPWAGTRYYRWDGERLVFLGPYFHIGPVRPEPASEAGGDLTGS